MEENQIIVLDSCRRSTRDQPAFASVFWAAGYELVPSRLSHHHHHPPPQQQQLPQPQTSTTYHVNLPRSLSPSQPGSLPPPPPPPPTCLPPPQSNPSQNSSSSSLSQANLKQLQYQQQQHNAMAAASAAAEFYEQQFKLQQHKNLEIEQQFRVHLEQLKELKVCFFIILFSNFLD